MRMPIKSKMRLLILTIILMFLSSCGNQNAEGPVLTVEELEAERGKPDKKEQHPLSESKTVLHYGDEQFQVQGNIVEAHIENPYGHQLYIQYWKNKYRTKQYQIRAVLDKAQGHHSGHKELIVNGEEPLRVIFDPASGRVKKVISR